MTQEGIEQVIKGQSNLWVASEEAPKGKKEKEKEKEKEKDKGKKKETELEKDKEEAKEKDKGKETIGEKRPSTRDTGSLPRKKRKSEKRRVEQKEIVQ